MAGFVSRLLDRAGGSPRVVRPLSSSPRAHEIDSSTRDDGGYDNDEHYPTPVPTSAGIESDETVEARTDLPHTSSAKLDNSETIDRTTRSAITVRSAAHSHDDNDRQATARMRAPSADHDNDDHTATPMRVPLGGTQNAIADGFSAPTTRASSKTRNSTDVEKPNPTVRNSREIDSDAQRLTSHSRNTSRSPQTSVPADVRTGSDGTSHRTIVVSEASTGIDRVSHERELPTESKEQKRRASGSDADQSQTPERDIVSHLARPSRSASVSSNDEHGERHATIIRPAVEQPIANRRARVEQSSRMDSATAQPPIIKVTIGRVEVRAVMQPPPAPPARTSTPKGPQLSLQEYLKSGNGGAR